MKIPFVDLKANYLSIKEEIDDAIQSVINDCAFIGGKYLEQFEENFAKKIGAKYCVGCSSGTAALQIAIKAHKSSSHPILTVPNTFIATAESIELNGEQPVFCDVCEDSALMVLQEAVNIVHNENIKTIIPVHLFGAVVDVDRLSRMLQSANCKDAEIIEDAAQAHFAKYNDGSYIGSKNTTCFSFFPSKNLGSFSDSGGITTNDRDLYNFMKAYRDHGRKSKFESDFVGGNFRMGGIQAAILDVKLNHIIDWNSKRRNNARLYDQRLSKIEQIKLMHKSYLETTSTEYERQVFHLYVIRELTGKRDDLKKYLEENGISCGIHYPIVINKQKVYKEIMREQSFPIAEKLSEEILSLPMYPELSEEQIEYVCLKVREFYQ